MPTSDAQTDAQGIGRALEIVNSDDLDVLVFGRGIQAETKKARLLDVIEKAYEQGYRRGLVRGGHLLRDAVIARLDRA